MKISRQQQRTKRTTTMVREKKILDTKVLYSVSLTLEINTEQAIIHSARR